MMYIGIDPGIKGAISIVDDKGKLVYCKPLPTRKEESKSGRKMSRIDIAEVNKRFAYISRKYSRYVLVIEKQIAMPGQNSIGTFNTGLGYGILLALISVNFSGQMLDIISCKEWQEAIITNRTFVLSKVRRDRRKQLKLDSVSKARELFPYFNFKRTARSKIDNDGMTDSSLMAYYCYQKHKSNG